MILISILGLLLLWMGTVEANFEQCNTTFTGLKKSPDEDGEAKLTLRLPEVADVHHGRPVYCWFRFKAEEGHYVQVFVREIKAGSYDVEAKDCSSGYLRISDEDSCSTDPRWMPPTTLCGHYPEGKVMVKRLTRSPLAFVEFKLDNANPKTGYEFDVTFLDRGDQSKLLYGDLQREDGRIEHTKCDWLIPVDQCIGWCQVISPGYPGIYPPNTRCRYTFTNFDEGRVELRLGGRGFSGKFDMKRDPNCTDDHVSIYDGASTLQPLIGRYCGLEGHHIISTGPSLLLIFQSGMGSPPWDYTGFKIDASDRWRNEHEGGTKVPETHCDWTFRSRDSKDGNIHTPDHISHSGTLCTFSFLAEYNERVEIRIVVNRNLDVNCTEKITIYDGDARNNETRVLDTICDDKIHKSREAFGFNTTGSTGSAQYYREDFQVSNPNPVWVYYVFWKDPTIKGSPLKPRSHSRNKVVTAEEALGGTGIRDAVTSWSCFLMTSLLTFLAMSEFG